MSARTGDWHRELRYSWPLLNTNRSDRTQMVVYPIGLDVAAGGVFIAVDEREDRHLLVPVRPGEAIQEDRRSAYVQIRSMPLTIDNLTRRYIDIVSYRQDLGDLFDDVLCDILELLSSNDAHASASCQSVLNSWREMFHARISPLTQTQQLGLFGELAVLERLLRRSRSISINQLWTGPDRTAHDFRLGEWNLEVKTAMVGKYEVQIHGLDQLTPPPGGKLVLGLVHLEKSNTGMSLPELAARVSALTDDSAGLDRQLAKAGFFFGDVDKYTSTRYGPPNFLGFIVDQHFPVLTQASLRGTVPTEISGVRYILDLSTSVRVALPHSEFIDLLEGREVL